MLEYTQDPLKQATHYQFWPPMPSHLEEFPIEIDKELEKWELDHQAGYSIIKPFSGPAQLEMCLGEGLWEILENLRVNVMEKKFPNVCYHKLLYTHF